MSDEKTTTEVMTLPPLSEGLLWHPVRFEHAQRVAKMFIQSGLVPQHLLNTGNGLGNVLIGLDLAARMNESPLFILQNIYFVGGKANWLTSYMIARTNNSRLFAEPLNWETEYLVNGDGEEILRVTCFAYLRSPANGGDARREAFADMDMAQKEGWVRNAKYKSMPEHMLAFRSAAMFIRRHCPQVLMGLDMLEEDDVEATERGLHTAWSGDGAIDVTPPAPKPEDFAPPKEPEEEEPEEEEPEEEPDEEPDEQVAEQSETPPEEYPEFVLVDADSNAYRYDSVEEAVDAFASILKEAAGLGRDRLQGVWEDNETEITQIIKLRPDVRATIHSTYQELTERFEPAPASSPPPESSPSSSPKSTSMPTPTSSPPPSTTPAPSLAPEYTTPPSSTPAPPPSPTSAPSPRRGRPRKQSSTSTPTPPTESTTTPTATPSPSPSLEPAPASTPEPESLLVEWPEDVSPHQWYQWMRKQVTDLRIKRAQPEVFEKLLADNTDNIERLKKVWGDNWKRNLENLITNSMKKR